MVTAQVRNASDHGWLIVPLAREGARLTPVSVLVARPDVTSVSVRIWITGHCWVSIKIKIKG